MVVVLSEDCDREDLKAVFEFPQDKEESQH